MLSPPRRLLVVAIAAAVLLTATAIGLATATPPATSTESNGLSPSEAATLWSGDADANQSATAPSGSGEAAAVRQLANGTDISFTRPPGTAATWTRNDFTDLTPEGTDTSLHPPNATLEDGRYIADAHATIFAAQPATYAHRAAGETTRYLAPTGSLRALIDYRLATEDHEGETWTTQVAVSDTDITTRLSQDGETITTQSTSQTPTIQYQLEDAWETTLTLEAEITVQIEERTYLNRNPAISDTVTYTETITVSDSLSGSVYNLSATPYYADYPNGDEGVALFQSQPWQGYTLTDDGETRVRGVWRFYTAGDSQWETLVQSQRDGDTTVASDAMPAVVHAYPSRIGPVAEPVRTGPSIIKTWGTNRSSPADTLGDHINVDVVNQTYTPSYGLGVRADTVDQHALRVAGIVRGVNATITPPRESETRQLHASTLSARVLSQNDSQATVRLELRDNQTDTSITLTGPAPGPVLGQRIHEGYITIGSQRVTTNASGVAVVTLDQPGIYTATYHPEAWLDVTPAYTSDRASVRWHPLGTLQGWFHLLIEVVWQFLPFAVLFYASLRLLRFLNINRFTNYD